ncbi:flagellar hook-basal body complex protein FliE [Tropicimonas sp.]|uniref:flagellar hook-basal body complex protein FliE n=1 Tax=Tropicimonas sp. TaxID=2067044 RepID=UPI003A896497
MEIGASLVQSAYRAAQPAVAPEPGSGAGADILGRVLNDFASTLAEGEAVSKEAMLGRSDPHALVMALTQTELAVETAATLRDRVVEAYQEILRMPV